MGKYDWSCYFSFEKIKKNIGWGKYKYVTLENVLITDFDYVIWMCSQQNITFSDEVKQLISILRTCDNAEQRRIKYKEYYASLVETKRSEEGRLRDEEELRQEHEKIQNEKLKQIGEKWIKSNIIIYTVEKLYQMTVSKDLYWKKGECEYRGVGYGVYSIKIGKGRIRLMKANSVVGINRNFRIRYECKSAAETIYGDYIEALWILVEEYCKEQRRIKLIEEEKQRKKEEKKLLLQTQLEEQKKKKDDEERMNKIKEEQERFQNLRRVPIEFVDVVIKKNTMLCENKHTVEDVIAVFLVLKKGGGKEDVEAPAAYCKECNCYFILEESYSVVREKGLLLCQVMTEYVYKLKQAGGSCDMADYLAEESPLRIAGYNVDKKHDLSVDERRVILEYLLDSGILSKNRILSYLDYFIRCRENMQFMEEAIGKWKEDRDYIATYNIGSKRHVRVGSITKREMYKRMK